MSRAFVLVLLMRKCTKSRGSQRRQHAQLKIWKQFARILFILIILPIFPVQGHRACTRDISHMESWSLLLS